MTDAPASPGRAPVRFRGGGFAPGSRVWIGVLGFVALFALWEAAHMLRWVNPILLPGPIEVGAAFSRLVASGEMGRHLAASLGRIGAGFAIGAAAGIVLGAGIALFTATRSIGIPLVSALFPIPKIAIMPILVLWFGIGEASKVATIALGVVFPMAIATYGAFDNVPRNLIRMAQSFDVPAFDILIKVMLPGAMPGILSGLRISASIALLLVVAAEMIGAQHGVGAFVLQAGNLMQTDQLLAGVLVLSLLGLTIGFGLGRLEKALLDWR